MNPLVGVAISLLPELLSLIKSSDGAKLISDKIAGIVAETTKVDTPAEANKLIESDPQLKADLQSRLAQMALEQQKASFEADDRRNTQANVSTGGARSAIRAQMDKSLLLSMMPAMISGAIVLGFFIVLGFMAMGKVGVSAGPDLDKLAVVMKDTSAEGAKALAGELERSRTREENVFQIFNILVGALATAFATVMNFWLGSSLGSRQKDAIASDVQTNQAVLLSRPPAAPAPAPISVAPQPSADPVEDGGVATPVPPVMPVSSGVLAENLPQLAQPHRHFPDGARWQLTKTGIAIDGAAAAGTMGAPSTVRKLWTLYGTDCATAAKRLGVPVELIVATIATESRGDASARRQEPQIGDQSVGLMQTLVKTARSAMGRPNLKADDLLDPRTSIEAGTSYIAQQRGSTHFDPPLVAAAYNAGSLKPDPAEANRWKLRCYPVGTGQHIDRFVAWFNDCMVVSAADGWGAGTVPSFAAGLGAAAKVTPAADASTTPTHTQISAPFVSDKGQDFPPRPDFFPLKDTAARQALFGKFDFAVEPQPGNPEHIRILGDWQAENIVSVAVTQTGIGKKGKPLAFDFNVRAAAQLKNLWAEWESAGLLDRIVTFDGSFEPRMIRGTTQSLSCHSFGGAFDINAALNPLQRMPPLVGQPGCVRELVGIANKWGFFWGGHFRTRLDGMHFEVAQLKS